MLADTFSLEGWVGGEAKLAKNHKRDVLLVKILFTTYRITCV